MREASVRAAGDTNPGLQREVNEDRFHCDPARGLFIVIDGVGGQAAGGKAAEVALDMLRARLERETGPAEERVREAITIANNEIYRLAAMRPEWNGMACVLTVAFVENGHAIVGHVGDTRLYKLRHGRIEKVTRDHSPVGEREDSDEISESEAMRHPRRNEVYRDVGSEPHQLIDPDFVDVQPVPFEADAALLLCSDGLSDLVPSATIGGIVKQFAGKPDQVVRALIDAANRAGGKDNVTAVYVEGERFAASQVRSHQPKPAQPERRGRQLVRAAMVALVALLTGIVLARTEQLRPFLQLPLLESILFAGSEQVVGPTGSIAAAIRRAKPGSQVVVEPGDYRERLVLKEGVRVVSRVPRAATIRLPLGGNDAEPAVTASGLSRAELVGFRIVGDAATPLGTGLLVRNAGVSIVDLEISGAGITAVDFAEGEGASLVGSDIHDNPGVGLAIRAGASPRISHNAFGRNGTSERAATSIHIDPGAQPLFQGNVFRGISPEAFGALGRSRLAVMRENVFPGVHEPTPSGPLSDRLRQGLR